MFYLKRQFVLGLDTDDSKSTEWARLSKKETERSRGLPGRSVASSDGNAT